MRFWEHLAYESPSFYRKDNYCVPAEDNVLCLISILQNISQFTHIMRIIKSDKDQMERRDIDM